jgi:hypothetical protein
MVDLFGSDTSSAIGPAADAQASSVAGGDNPMRPQPARKDLAQR